MPVIGKKGGKKEKYLLKLLKRLLNQLKMIRKKEKNAFYKFFMKTENILFFLRSKKAVLHQSVIKAE